MSYLLFPSETSLTDTDLSVSVGGLLSDLTTPVSVGGKLKMMRVRTTDPRPCPKCGKIYRNGVTIVDINIFKIEQLHYNKVISVSLIIIAQKVIKL